MVARTLGFVRSSAQIQGAATALQLKDVFHQGKHEKNPPSSRYKGRIIGGIHGAQAAWWRSTSRRAEIWLKLLWVFFGDTAWVRSCPLHLVAQLFTELGWGSMGWGRGFQQPLYFSRNPDRASQRGNHLQHLVLQVLPFEHRKSFISASWSEVVITISAPAAAREEEKLRHRKGKWLVKDLAS